MSSRKGVGGILRPPASSALAAASDHVDLEQHALLAVLVHRARDPHGTVAVERHQRALRVGDVGKLACTRQAKGQDAWCIERAGGGQGASAGASELGQTVIRKNTPRRQGET